MMGNKPKIRFLTADNKGAKFKRNVPKPIQEIVGRTAWVKRTQQSSTKLLREEGLSFEISTKAQIELAKAQLAVMNNKREMNPGLLHLSKSASEYYALKYFHETHDRRQANRYYSSPQNLTDYDVEVSVAGEDSLIAEATMEKSSGHDITPKALRILQNQNVIDDAEYSMLNNANYLKKLAENHNFQFLCSLIERADLELAKLKYLSLTEQVTPKVADKFFTRSPSAVRVGAAQHRKINDLIDLVKNHYEHSGSISRRSQFNLPFRLLKELHGAETELDKITRDHARSLARLMPLVPAYLSGHYGGYSVKEAIEIASKKEPTRKPRYDEARKLLIDLKLMFKMAVEEGWLDRSPFEGLSIEKPGVSKVSKNRGYEPFSIAQLNDFFSLPIYTGCVNDEHGAHKIGPNIVRRHRYWAPIVALFTGMRMNEILQLEKQDIDQDENGIVFFSVTDEEKTTSNQPDFEKRLKTKHALRKIPVHKFLDDFGFLKWVAEQPNGRLFPEAGRGQSEKPSNLYSKRFRNDLKKANIWKRES